MPLEDPASRREEELLDQAAAWLKAYFATAGSPAQDTLPPLPPLALAGTEFERAVWRALRGIGYGEVVTYGDIARRLGKPVAAARAIGQANRKNPLPIFVPCHRVVAAGGELGGYSAGLERKRWLLAHEGISVGKDRPRAVAQPGSYGVF
jgi:methylated-DNA-[protein]-cysteine S-methyltransferase